jgi:hypothetical protein
VTTGCRTVSNISRNRKSSPSHIPRRA